MTTKIKVDAQDPYSAARAALAKIILAKGSGWSLEDREDALQEAAFAAARAAAKFDDAGLAERKTGKRGYMVQAARWAGLGVAERRDMRQENEVAFPLDGLVAEEQFLEAELAEVLEAAIDDVEAFVQTPIHAKVARLVLDPASPARMFPSWGQGYAGQILAVAAEVGLSVGKVRTLVDELAAFWRGTQTRYSAL